MKKSFLLLSFFLTLFSLGAFSKSLNLFDLAANNIKNESGGGGYNRSKQFGSWVVRSGGCYNTRHFILAKYSVKKVVHDEGNPCRVKRGEWHPQYTDQPRAISNPRKLHVDHLIPLKEAYVSGAKNWSSEKRCHFTNFLDYENQLVLVTARENLRKGARGPADYMPPNKNIKCEYIRQWMAVKTIWQLSYDRREFDALVSEFQKNKCKSSDFLVNINYLNHYRMLAEDIIPACDSSILRQ